MDKRGDYGDVDGGAPRRQPQDPCGTWQAPQMPKASPEIAMLPPAPSNLQPSETLAFSIQKPKSPGSVACATMECLTNYYELRLGLKAQVAFFYAVEIKKIDTLKKPDSNNNNADPKISANANAAATQSGQAGTPVTQGLSNGAKKERRLGLRLNRAVFSMIPTNALNNQMFAYDGKHRACGLRRLTNDDSQHQVEFGNHSWQVQLNYIKAVSLDGARPGVDFSTVGEFEESLLALAVMLNHMPSLQYTPLGRGFYGLPGDKPTVIGGGFELWTGYKAHVLPGADKLFVNLNYAVTAFLRAGDLVDCVCELLSLDRDKPQSIKPKEVKDLAKMLSRCKAELIHLKRPRHITIQSVTAEPANGIHFNDRDGKLVSVAEYFARTYGPLQYPEWPCVEVGTEKPVYYPLEVVKLSKGNPYRGEQTPKLVSEKILHAALPPRNRLQEIRFKARALASQRETRDEFDIHIEPEELVVPSRILPTPILTAGKNTIVKASPGVIDCSSTCFFKTSKIDRWTIVNTDERQRQDDLQYFAQIFHNQGLKIGVQLAEPVLDRGEFPTITDRQSIEKVELQIKNIVTVNNLDFVLFVISDDTTVHSVIKFTCDVTLGVSSKCVKSSTVRRVRRSESQGPDQCIVNILYGLNPKFDGENVIGINTEFSYQMLTSTPTIIIGLDVNHGQAIVREGLPKMPSTVGIVGTRNLNATLYTAVMRAQRKPASSADREIIQPSILKPAIKELMMSFYQKSGRKPERIIVYRDGVSNSQFNAVLATEMKTIIEVCDELPADQGTLKYRPPITLVAVQKRHDTRLFPKKVTVDRDGNERQNPLAGTVVDTVLPSRRWWNFFLNSHEGTRTTTSRPAHYIVLFDENGFSNDQMQSLTYYLCHLYGKCPRAVSIPAPTYYAHWVAARAAEVGAFNWNRSPEFSQYEARSYTSSKKGVHEDEKTLLDVYSRSLEMKPEFRQKMYFL